VLIVNNFWLQNTIVLTNKTLRERVNEKLYIDNFL
jgi:hypothetical protein